MIVLGGPLRWHVDVEDEAGETWAVDIEVTPEAIERIAAAAVANVTKRSTRGGFLARAHREPLLNQQKETA